MTFTSKNNSNNSGCTGTGVKIIGFGNKYRSDDGIGIRVVEELERLDSFKNIEIIDGGTSGTNLIFLLKDCRKVIIIDAVDTGQNIGDVVNIKVNDIEEFIKRGYKSLSLHDLNLVDIFSLLKVLKINADISIIGVRPKNIDFGDRLSPEIEEKIPEIISIIKKETGI
ncbi:MAG: hydrogenase maturation protease [Actinobacteria bacterium]|nr:hydrogenase maturation protease [Actinomycetota bacterium]